MVSRVRCASALALALLVVPGCKTSDVLQPDKGSIVTGALRKATTETSRNSSAYGPDTGEGASTVRRKRKGLRRLFGQRGRKRRLTTRRSGAAGQPVVKAFIDTGSDERRNVTFHLVNAPVRAAAKAVLGDSLNLTYTVSPEVNANVTVRTASPVTKAEALKTFASVLTSSNIGLRRNDAGVLELIPSNRMRKSRTRLAVGRRAPTGPGETVQIVPLNHVSASDMTRLLQPVAPQGSVQPVEEAGNLIMVRGESTQVATVLDAVDVFDSDWLEGMSFELIQLGSADPVAIAAELKPMFAGTRGRSDVRIVPNTRLNAILIISPRERDILRARQWIAKLDAATSTVEHQAYVYRIQNRSAVELAKLLENALSAKQTVSSKRNVAVRETGEPGREASSSATLEADGGNISRTFAGVRIVADEPNNSLLIMASPDQYEMIERILHHIDVAPRQILLEATIAEVTLNDQLRFGVKFFLERNLNRTAFTDVVSGLVNSTFPGFSYLFSSSNVSIAVDALSEVTDVKVVSRPSLTVMDSRRAELQIGDQVPITTRTASSTSDPNAPVVNQVSLKDTGVILAVTPRIAESGRVLLDIEQEVSDVVRTTSSGIDSPTIQQRRVKTSVVVQDGETLVLGGIMQASKKGTREQVPVLGEIPILGSAFRRKVDREARTELVIFINLKVIHDPYEVSDVMAEFRKGLIAQMPTGPSRYSAATRQAVRIFD